MINQRFGNRWS